MSDYCERIVDVEVSGEEAPAVAKRMVDWMIEEGLITREMSDDGVYSWGVDEGYLPGPNWKRAVTDHSEDSWAPGPVAILVGREHHIDGSLGEDTASSATCPRCANKTVIINDPDEIDLDEIDSDEIEPDEEAWRPFSDGIEAWQETGKGHVACPSCGEAVSVTEWQFDNGTGTFVLAALAFDFWGWPELDPDFHAEFSKCLGHRTVMQTGKF